MIGFFPANSIDEDVELYADETRARRCSRGVHFLRQQKDLPDGKPHGALADFVAPKDQRRARLLRRVRGHRRASASRSTLQRFEAEHDDYSSIMLKVLADRLAEAFAERLHERVRREFWGYAPDEKLGNEQLIREEYRGIRPAPGYPACPDHTEKATLWRLLDVDAARRHRADRVVCDVSDRGGQRLVLLASASRATLPSAASIATRSRTTRAARA